MLVSTYEWEASPLQKVSLSYPPKLRVKSRMEGAQVKPSAARGMSLPWAGVRLSGSIHQAQAAWSWTDFPKDNHCMNRRR